MKFLYGLLLTTALFGQAKPEFEVASIKPSTAAPEGVFNLGVHIDGAQVRCTYMSLKDYIVRAYQIKSYQFSGPDWMASQRFDISAKLPAGASRDQVPAMLKALLDDRFQIKTHTSSKEFAVYALTVGKAGLKIKESPLDEAAGPSAVNVDVHAGAGNTMVDLGKGASISFGEDRLDGKKLTMTIFADQLARFVDRPVVDMTGLQGTYDLSLQFQRDDFRPMRIRAALAAGVQLPPQALRLLENASDGPLLTAIQTLGLKLESRKAPLDVLVVDSALKSPTEN